MRGRGRHLSAHMSSAEEAENIRSMGSQTDAHVAEMHDVEAQAIAGGDGAVAVWPVVADGPAASDDAAIARHQKKSGMNTSEWLEVKVKAARRQAAPAAGVRWAAAVALANRHGEEWAMEQARKQLQAERAAAASVLQRCTRGWRGRRLAAAARMRVAAVEPRLTVEAPRPARANVRKKEEAKTARAEKLRGDETVTAAATCWAE